MFKGFVSYIVILLTCLSAEAIALKGVPLQPGMRVGILAGSYSPFHLRHEELALQALKEGGLDYILIVANDITPHKPNIISYKHRSQMLWNLYKKHPQILVLDPKQVIFPVVTNSLRHLRTFPDVELVGLMGFDSSQSIWSRLGAWYLSMAPVGRTQTKRSYDFWGVTYHQRQNPKKVPEVIAKSKVELYYTPSSIDPHSSEIREALLNPNRSFESLAHLPLHPKTLNYILKNALYQKQDKKWKAYCKWAFAKVIL